MDLITPDPDELEISVFGRGFGEAVCVHIGNADWILVDSCLNPQTNQPAGLTYLTSLGLAPAEVVRLVVVTHWDDDHVAGIGRIVHVCTQSTVACSAALKRTDILEFVISQEVASGALGSGVDELRTILRLARNRIIWAKANLPLHPRPPGDVPVVVALSPSEDSVLRSVESLIQEATRKDITVARRYTAPEGPNGASVVTSVRKDGLALLLGADLEKSNNPEAGWDAVLKYSKPTVRASVLKIPHHGSSDADHPATWTDLAEDQVVAILTPWARGGRFLPREKDLERIRSLTGRAYLTAMPSLRRSKMESEIERMLRKLHSNRVEELRGWGQVRARRHLSEKDWRLELDGDAVAV